MTRITLDAASVELLKEANGQVLFCDEQGNTVRILFTPDVTKEPLLSEEDWQRILAEPGEWLTTAELVEHLKKLGAS